MKSWRAGFGSYLLGVSAFGATMGFLACGGSSADAPRETRDAAPDVEPVAFDAAPPVDASDASKGLDASAADADAGKDSGRTTTTLYYGELLTLLAAGQLDRTFKFYTEITYETAVDAGEAGTPGSLVSVSLTAIKSAATTVAKLETTGAPLAKTTVAVGPNGKFTAAMGTMTIPGDANPISGRMIVIDNVVLTGGFARPGQFCSQFAGDVVSPVAITLSGDSNTMLYDPVADGDAQPVRGAADFQAGCAVPAD